MTSHAVRGFISKFESLTKAEVAPQTRDTDVSGALRHKGNQLTSQELRENVRNNVSSSLPEANMTPSQHINSDASTSTSTSQEMTLGQFLSANKSVSEFIMKRSPSSSPEHDTDEASPPVETNGGYVNLPDLVKRNGTTKLLALHAATPTAATCTSVSNEGTPEDLSTASSAQRSRFSSDSSTVTSSSVFADSDSNLTSCMSTNKQLLKVKKRVRISEINNTHHLYEAGQEHGFIMAEEYDINSDDIADDVSSDVDQSQDCSDDNVTQGCYNLKSGISTVYDNNQTRYLSNTQGSAPLNTSLPNTNPQNQNGANVTSTRTQNGASENSDWQVIKQCPDVGFYI